MQHTQCGLTRIHDRTELLATYFDVAENDLGAVPVTDPYAAVARDVSLLRADGRLGSARVSGLVYDVATGKVATVASG